jgi:3-isopropylmalate/(R)-2-methylmalate dehydratase small subunit
VRAGDVIVAGRNFGCGSSREHAPVSIRATGVIAVVAISFARIFARNAVNIGLPVIRCAEAAAAIADGDEVAVDFRSGTVIAGGRRWSDEPPSALAVRIAEAGGLVELLRSAGWAALEESTT